MASLQRVRQVSRLLARLCWVPMVLMVVFFLLFVAGIQPIEYKEEHTTSETTEFDDTTTTITNRYYFGYDERFESGLDLTFPARFVYAVFTSLPAATLLFGLLKLKDMFNTYAVGEFFSEKAASYLKWFAIGLIGYVLLEPLSDFCRHQVLMFASTGDISTTSNYGGADFSTLFLGGVFLVIAWVLGEAARLAEDNRSIV